MDYIAQLESRGITGRLFGKNLMISCPFHDDSNPSLGVHIEKGVFQCNSGVCGEKGNFTKLIAEIDGISYEEAEIALRSELSIDETIKEIESLLVSETQKTSLNKSLNVKKFHSMFPPLRGSYCENYIVKKRHISLEFADKFDLRCGVLLPTATKKHRIRWNRRVIIPIYDHRARLITFAGRSVDSNPFIKTLKYSAKDSVLFGLNLLLKKQKKLPYIVLVEGEFDCIYLQSLNILAVSTMGTSGLNSSHISILLKITDIIFICFDGDKAGRVASKKLYTLLGSLFSVYILKLPKGKDPNDLTKKEVFNYIKNPIMQFLIAWKRKSFKLV